jgi:diketogulonate reductase-like aldo/keto reductase
MNTNRRTFLKRAIGATAASVFAEEIGRSLTARAQPATAPAPGGAETMLLRKIPSTGESVPAVGLGTWNALNPRDVNEKTLAPLTQVLQVFFESGGRVVDTAPSYGTAEEVVGILAQKLGMTEKLFFATKVLEHNEADGIRSFERSFQRLKRTGKIDLMQCHNFIDWPTQLKSMRKWKDEGKFRYIGVTHYQDHAHEELERIIKRDKVDFLQTNYSIAEPAAAKRLLPAAKDAGVAVLINRPFEAGGLFRAARTKPLPDFVKPFAASWAQAFLKFVLANDAVTSVIGATGNPEHMRDNLRAGFGPLPDGDQLKRLTAALA